MREILNSKLPESGGGCNLERRLMKASNKLARRPTTYYWNLIPAQRGKYIDPEMAAKLMLTLTQITKLGDAFQNRRLVTTKLLVVMDNKFF